MQKARLQQLSVMHLNLMRLMLVHGNAQKVASELKLSGAAVSYQLSKLREIFEDDLFVRVSGGLKPTDYCLSLYPKIIDILSRIEEGLTQPGCIDPSAIEREIVVNACVSTVSWFPELLMQARQQLPRVNLTFRTWHSHSYQAIADGCVDFGIQRISGTSKQVLQMDLDECQRVMVVRKGHPLANKGQMTLQDLQDYPVLLVDLVGWNDSGNSLIERVLQQHQLQANIVGRVGDISAVLQTVAQTNCISYITSLNLPDDNQQFVLLRAPAELEQECHLFRLFVSRQRYGSEEFSFLTDFLAQSFIGYSKKKRQLYEQRMLSSGE